MPQTEEEIPYSSRRSLLPVTDSVAPGPPPRPDSGWIMALATLGIMASVPFMLQHVTNVSDATLAPESEPGVAANPGLDELDGLALHTVAVREAPARWSALRQSGAKISSVPRSVVTLIDGKAMVIVAEKGLRLLVATPVELGATDGSNQRILSGLTAGQMVVSEDAATLQRLASRR